MTRRSHRSDFLTITKPWIEKIEVTKDLKPVRKADFFLLLKEIVSKAQDEADFDDHQLFVEFHELRRTLEFHPVGGKKIREDLWRRLLFLEISWPNSANF